MNSKLVIWNFYWIAQIFEKFDERISKKEKKTLWMWKESWLNYQNYVKIVTDPCYSFT